MAFLFGFFKGNKAHKMFVTIVLVVTMDFLAVFTNYIHSCERFYLKDESWKRMQ